jgi:tetratricopeptide (TPR) repeat protein
MTTKATETNPDRSFTPAVLPWIVAAGGLIAYLLTLNHWLALNSFTMPPYAGNSLAEVSRVSGWSWQPALMEPLYWLATYPISFLPEARIPLALNLCAALCAAMVLWQLARTVAILPHDRTEDQRQREKNSFSILGTRTNWMPPIAAALVCGLQLSFWENATVASGEMLNLLLFAYVLRCLLEFRLDENERWLTKAVFVFALGITNNWGMVGYFPLLVAALIWLKRLSFFQAKFLGKMALVALAGLLMYLLLPIVASAKGNVDVSFWQALKYNIGSQKGLLSSITFNKQMLFLSDRPLWVLGLPSLLPLLVMSIRWPSYFGDPSRLGVALATLIFHFFHAVLFVVCMWVMLDPAFSPRNLLMGSPLLSLYYLYALAVGYLTGYFALVFGSKPSSRQRPGLPSNAVVDAAVLAIIWAAVLMIPAALAYRNWPVIASINGTVKDKKQTPAREFAEAAVVGLPKEGAIVLSDDARKMAMARSALTEKGVASRYVFIDTQSLNWVDYHRFLARAYPKKFKDFVPADAKGQIEPSSLIQVLFYLAQSNAVYYLHPSFGYYFEAFWMEPKGLCYELHTYATNLVLAPPLSPAALKYNQEFWAGADRNAVGRMLLASERLTKVSRKGFVDQLFKKARLEPQEPRDLYVIGSFYSRARNTWGVEMQKADDWKAGEGHFERALELNSGNLVAKMNLEYNQQRQSGAELSKELMESPEDFFGRYRSWDQLMNDNGPFDEPRFCFEQGRVFVRGNLYRQSAHQFQRVREMAPSHLQSRLWLAQVYVLTRQADGALEVIDEIRKNAGLLGAGRTNNLELMSIEGAALFIKGEPDKAIAVVEDYLGKNPQDEALLATATQLFMNNAQYTNALDLIDRQLRIQPDNPAVLVNKGFAFLQTARYEQAIPALTRALDLQTNTTSELYQSALFNRAIAYLQSGKLEDSERDYATLQKAFPTAYKLYYGLAEIAYRKQDTNAAVRQYNLYLANAPTNTAEAEFVRNRIKELRKGRF